MLSDSPRPFSTHRTQPPWNQGQTNHLQNRKAYGERKWLLIWPSHTSPPLPALQPECTFMSTPSTDQLNRAQTRGTINSQSVKSWVKRKAFVKATQQACHKVTQIDINTMKWLVSSPLVVFYITVFECQTQLISFCHCVKGLWHVLASHDLSSVCQPGSFLGVILLLGYYWCCLYCCCLQIKNIL